MVAIGIGIAIAIAVILGFTANPSKENTISLNSTLTPTVPTQTTQTPTPPSQPVTQGRHFSVNLTETVGASAH